MNTLTIEKHQQLLLHAEQIKAIYQQATMTAVNSWATGLIVIFIPNPAAPRLTLALWFLALTLSCAARLLLAWRFRRSDIALERYARWGHYYVLAIVSTSLVWSSTLWVLASPAHLEYEMLFLTVLVAMCIGASHASTSYLPAGQAYTIPAMTIMVIFCLLKGTPVFYGLAILGTLYAVMMNVVGKDSNKRFLEIQRLRYELADKKEEAERANIAKSKFLAAASHDLRQPLHALTLFTTALKEKISYPEVAKIVDNIDKSVEALQGLFNALLDISKLDAGSLQIEKHNVALANVLSPIVTEFRAEANKKGLQLKYSESLEHVETDPALLSRILRNLVSNALRYTENGSITIATSVAGDTVELSVADTGRGIPKEKQTEIFKEFVQLHNPERDREKGLGLGLAIVHRLITLLGYRLRLESAPHRGSCFTIELPRAEPVVLEEHDDRVVELEGTHTTANAELNVLVIDDEAAVREGAITLLETWQYKVLACADVDSCIAEIREKHFNPDVILADYRLQKNKTGVDAIEEINRFLGKKVNAAIITGDTAADRIREAESSGYLIMHKPFKPMQLRAFLNRVQQAVRP